MRSRPHAWMRRTLCVCACILVAAHAASAQQSAGDTTSAPLSVYVDCEDYEACDFDFFRTDIVFVNWVRDRQVADVHMLVTTQATGAGGREFTVTFIGLRQFAGIADTLRYVAPPAATQDEKRRALARVFRAGLVRYLARTPAAEKIVVSLGAAATEQPNQTNAARDRWHYWVFRASLNGYLNGEKTYDNYNMYNSVSANRVTARWKTELSLNTQYNQSSFELDSVTTYTNIQRGYGASGLQVKSINEHWSAGGRLNVYSSSYDNTRRAVGVFPALEYDVFPYSAATRRQLRLEYNIGVQDYAWNDTTIFDRLRERRPVHRLLASVATRESWGSIDVGTNATGYLDDHTQYRVGSFAQLSLRLFKGFSVQAFGSYSLIQDQFGLAKKDFTPEQILTRAFQRGTTYRFFGNVGISYTFGSIFNNVVNPRMASMFFGE